MTDIIQVTRSSMPEFEEYVDEIRDIWETHWMTNMGVKHKRLQKELKKYLDVENIELFTNGHMALELSLQSLGLHGEVITSPYTFASTTHAIVRNGLEPVFCDINSEDFTIDVTKIENLITEKTSAIIPVHVIRIKPNLGSAVNTVFPGFFNGILFKKGHRRGKLTQ